MNIRMGGGALKLQTDYFSPGTPTDLQVREILSFVVLNPLPPEPPVPVVNNVQRINFYNVPAAGFQLPYNLKTVLHRTYYADQEILLRISDAQLRLRYQNNWASAVVHIYTGSEWLPAQIKIWDGETWSN
jgi:hypothetical protein